MSGDGTSQAWSQLRDAWARLDGAWNDVGAAWRDRRSRSFEGTYIRPIGAQVQATEKALEELGRVFREAQARVS